MGICVSFIFGLIVCSGIMLVSGLCPKCLSVVGLVKCVCMPFFCFGNVCPFIWLTSLGYTCVCICTRNFVFLQDLLHIVLIWPYSDDLVVLLGLKISILCLSGFYIGTHIFIYNMCIWQYYSTSFGLRMHLY